MHRQLSVVSYQLSVLLIAGLCLSGCIRTRLDPPRAEEIEGRDFAAYLAREYLYYSQKKEDEGNRKVAQYFSDKSIRTASGRHTDPEHPEDWDIPAKILPELKEARMTLMDTITSKSMLEQPKASARAYALYDCWVENEEKSWLSEKIETCRNEFFEVLNYLSINNMPSHAEDITYIAEVPVPYESPDVKESYIRQYDDVEYIIREGEPEMVTAINISPETIPDAEIAVEDTTVVTENIGGKSEGLPVSDLPRASDDKPEVVAEKKPQITFIIPFKSENTDIGEEAAAEMERLKAKLAELGTYRVILNGHTEELSSESESLRFSVRLAETVRNELDNVGIDPQRMQTFGFGSSDPAGIDGEEVNSNRVEVVVVESE